MPIQSEDDLESKPVAIPRKHAYNKTILSSPSIQPIKTEQPLKPEASPLKVISNERDRINNLAQKEKRLAEAGVTRRKAYQVIADLLDAVKTIQQTDDQGNVKWVEAPDMEKRFKGAELAIKMFGDMIERREVEYSVGDETLEKMKKLSVAELKARASELLLGKSVSRLPPLDVTPESIQ